MNKVNPPIFNSFRTNETFKIMNCPCRSSVENSKWKTIKCPTCNQYQHENCLKDLVKIKNFQCPSCQFKEMDPFIKTVMNIMPPSLLKYENRDVKNQFVFSVNKETFAKVDDFIKLANYENPLFIMIRSLRLDEKGYEHHWPLNFSIIANGNTLKSGQIPKFPPRSRSRIDYPLSFYFKLEDFKPTGNPHNLNKDHFFQANKYINFNSNAKNTLEILSEFTKNDNDKFSYAFSVDLVEVIKAPEEVIKNILVVEDTKILSSFFSKSQKSNSVADYDEICSSEKVSLIDCYTRSKRISIPARSFNCLHMSVFDLKFFLAMNRKNKSYDCPLCRKKASRLYVDGFIANILKENKEIEEILLSQNYVIETNIKENGLKSESKKMQNLDHGFISSQPLQISQTQNPNIKSSIKNKENLKENNIVLDLIESPQENNGQIEENIKRRDEQTNRKDYISDLTTEIESPLNNNIIQLAYPFTPFMDSKNDKDKDINKDLQQKQVNGHQDEVHVHDSNIINVSMDVDEDVNSEKESKLNSSNKMNNNYVCTTPLAKTSQFQLNSNRNNSNLSNPNNNLDTQALVDSLVFVPNNQMKFNTITPLNSNNNEEGEPISISSSNLNSLYRNFIGENKSSNNDKLGQKSQNLLTVPEFNNQINNIPINTPVAVALNIPAEEVISNNIVSEVQMKNKTDYNKEFKIFYENSKKNFKYLNFFNFLENMRTDK